MTPIPEKLVFKKRRGYKLAGWILFLTLGMLALVLGLAAFTGAKPDELILPAVAIGSMDLVVTILVLGGTALQVMFESRRIRHLLDDGYWVEWRYSPEEWKRDYEARFKLENFVSKTTYFNVVIGLILGGGMAFAAVYVIKDPQLKPIILAVAAFVALIYIVTGLIAPIFQRSAASARYQARASINAPRLYIGASGLYHEADGFTSFRRLLNADFQPGEPATINLKIRVRIQRYHWANTYVPVAVPAGREAEAQAITARLMQEVVR